MCIIYLVPPLYHMGKELFKIYITQNWVVSDDGDSHIFLV